jgi:hypothetical protein
MPGKIKDPRTARSKANKRIASNNVNQLTNG